MKAIGVTEFGGPDALTVIELPEPHPGPGEARIKVAAAAVNPTDTVVRSGARGTGDRQPPYIPGMDAAGVIDEVGEGSKWQVGDEVMAIALPYGEHQGAYVEYLVGDDASMARIPANTDIITAAALPMNALTATQILEKLGLRPGQTLAVTGAAGTLGNYLVQLAKHAGLVVIADAADKDRQLVESLGPDHIVPRGDDVASHIRRIAPDGVDGLADAALQRDQAAPAIREDGAMAIVRAWDGRPGRGIDLHQAGVFDEYRSGEKLDRIRALAEDGVLTPRVAATLPSGQAPGAHRRLEAGGVRGRILLTFP
ncbi:NADP-dependent oxidoreductase [Arthrobacter castelli]|uniref:NADP-dependent oxidoreductase n=1 Tax=Arthrobacter castelli TaxID=271431 RepID=UPI000421C08B|nr:NADP-dependent oxidoreductase [Arthrobacter castelli]